MKYPVKEIRNTSIPGSKKGIVYIIQKNMSLFKFLQLCETEACEKHIGGSIGGKDTEFQILLSIRTAATWPCIKIRIFSQHQQILQGFFPILLDTLDILHF